MASSMTLGAHFRWFTASLLAPALLFFAGPQVSAQAPGDIRGRVSRVTDGAPIAEALVTVVGTNRRVSTGADGHYALRRIPGGRYAIRIQAVGYAPAERQVDMADAALVQLDVALEAAAVQLGEIVVEGASRTSEKLLDAPAAVSVVTPEDVRAAATVGAMPRVFINMPGVDVVQGDLHDIKVSARGFTPSSARTVLVLQDGRDLSIPFLGLQQWAALSIPPDDAETIEFIRGPGSALYGANAYSGVINIVTPQARDVVGTKLRVVGGELSSRQGDMRHAGVLAGGRMGYRVNLGYSRSRSWSRSRTRYDRQDWADEYAPAIDSTLPQSPGPERLPLNGQTLDSTTGEAVGTPEDLVGMYGSARLDWYADNGSVATLDGGIGRVENGVGVSGLRVQVIDDIRPWARAAWSASHYHVQASYSGRTTLEPQVVLGSGTRQEDVSSIYHGDAQYRTSLRGERVRIVTGISLQLARINTQGTLFLPANDDRSDWAYGAYGQADYALTRRLRVIGALRWDKGDLFDAEVTPRVGLLWRPGSEHALRLTLNRAFLTPSHSERFLNIQAASPLNLSTLEDSLRASTLGPALESVPAGELFTTSAAVPFLVTGNVDLLPQKVTSLEVGYRGQLSRHIFATLDTYLNRKNDFVTGSLPATVVNPAYQPWTAPSAVPPSERQAVEEAVRDSLAARKLPQQGLTRLPDGSTAIVLSIGNAGLVYEWGVELGLVGQVTDELTLSASYAYFGYDIRRQHEGDLMRPNAPRHKGGASLTYGKPDGVDFQLSGHFVEGYLVASGIFRGYVPTSITADLSAGYRVSPNLRLHAVATDLFNRRQFQTFGGSVEGRRILAGITATF